MDNKNFFDSRLIDEPSLRTLQANIEKAIALQTPQFWGQVISGLSITITSGILAITKGVATGKQGERIFLKEDFQWQINVTSDILSLAIGFRGKKVPVGTMQDEEGKEQAESFEDACDIFVRGRSQADIDSGAVGSLIYTTAEDENGKAIETLSNQTIGDILYYQNLTAYSYLEAIKSTSMDNVLWWGFLTRELNAAEGTLTDWLVDSTEEYLNETKQSLLHSQILPRGAILHLDVEPAQLASRMVNLIESQTRWRVANGQDLPLESGLRKNGKTKVLDLRNRFVRSWDETQELGRHQGDAFQGHAWDLWSDRNDNWHYHVQGNQAGHVGIGYSPKWNAGTSWIRMTSDGTNGMPRTANETRPQNIMLLTLQLT